MVVEHVDIIGEAFWRNNPGILGKAVQDPIHTPGPGATANNEVASSPAATEDEEETVHH